MMPAEINVGLPAVSIMQSIVDDQARLDQANRPGLPGSEQPTSGAPGKPSVASARVLEEVYFGSHTTATEAMVHLFKQVARHLTDAMDAVEAGKVAAAGATAVHEAVADLDADDRTFLSSALQQSLDGSGSLQQAAFAIAMTVDLEKLSMDGKLLRDLEKTIGFSLDGMTVTDLIAAFADPYGKAAEKVRDVISEGLAGQVGSKAMQRLEDAAQGPKTVDEAKNDAVEKRPYDEVDAELKEEDEADIDAARVMETLGLVRDAAEAAVDDESQPADKTELAAVKAWIEAIREKGDTEPADEEPDPGDPAEDEQSLVSGAYLEF